MIQEWRRAIALASLLGLAASAHAGVWAWTSTGPAAPVDVLAVATFGGERYLLAHASQRDNPFLEPLDVPRVVRRRGATSNLWTTTLGAAVFNQKHAIAAIPGFPGTVVDFGERRRTDDAGATWYEAHHAGGYVDMAGSVDGVPGTTFVHGLARASSIALLGPGSALVVEPDSTTARPLSLTGVGAIAVAPSDIRVIYAIHNDDPLGLSSFYTRLRRSADRGVTWQERSLPAPTPFAQVHALLVDPLDADHLYATFRNAPFVVESTDSGTSWTATEIGMQSTRGYNIAIDDVVQPRRLYVGSDKGLFYYAGSTGWVRVPGTQGWHVGDVRFDGPAIRRTQTIATDQGVWEHTEDLAADTVSVYRFYNVDTQTHFYTASTTERDHVIATWPQFHYEGVAFHAITPSRPNTGMPVWRFFNTLTGAHFYTASAEERAHVLATWPQFVDEGVAYRALPGSEPGTVKLFRFFNLATSAHFYTTSDAERAAVDAQLPSYQDEGVAYAVYPAVASP